MKLLRILAGAFEAQPLVDHLSEDGFAGVTIREVLGSLPTDAASQPLTPRVELSVALHDARLPRALEALGRARTRHDLSVLVEPLATAVRIRTGEVDEAAIW